MFTRGLRRLLVALLLIAVCLGGADAVLFSQQNTPIATITLTSVPSSGSTSSTLSIACSYTVGTPSGATAVWNPGAITATVTSFSSGAGVCAFTASTPASANTYTLSMTGTGGNTASATAGNTTVISSGGSVPVVNVSSPIGSTGLAGTGLSGQTIWSGGTLTATNSPTSWAITSQPCTSAFAISSGGVLTGGSGASCMAPGFPGQAYSVTVTATNGSGTSAGQAISVTMYPDGALDAPAGATIQHPTYLNSYSAGNRPPWQVAGIHYPVGPPSGVTYKSPLIDTLPSGCSYNAPNNWVRCISTNNILFDSWDFTVSGGVRLFFDQSNDPVITNSKFGGTNMRSVDDIITNGNTSSVGITIKYSIVDGGFTATGQTGSQTTLIKAGGGNTTSINLYYNWLSNYGQHVLETGSAVVNYKYNLIDQAMVSPGAHMNCLQMYDGNMTPTVVYNFMYQSQLDGAECFQFYGGVAPTITLNTAYLSNNVMIAIQNGGTNTMSYMNTGLNFRTTFVGPAVSNDNFFDTSGAVGAYYPGSFTYGGAGSWTGARNKLLTDGSTVTFPPP